jgi:hypothetical protein
MNEFAFITANNIAISLEKGEIFQLQKKFTPNLQDIFEYLEKYDDVEILWNEFKSGQTHWFQPIKYNNEVWIVSGSFRDGKFQLFKN